MITVLVYVFVPHTAYHYKITPTKNVVLHYHTLSNVGVANLPAVFNVSKLINLRTRVWQYIVSIPIS